MAKKPPLSSKLTVCKDLKWTKHFEPKVIASAPSLRNVYPYPDLPTVIHLCKDSYSDSPSSETISDSFKRLWSVSSDKSGYFGAIYLNESAQQLVLVHRGTNIKNLGALKADADVYFNKISRQMISAMTCTHELKNQMEKLFPKWKLIIAGHSLGSYLTDVSIFSHMYLEPNESGIKFHKQNSIEGPRSVTVLPYGIGIDGPGSFDIILKLRDLTDVRYGSGERMRVNDLPVDHYVGVPNLVNCHNRQVGGLFQIPMGSSEKKNIPILSSILEFMDNCTGKITTHFLDNFISAFTGNNPSPIKEINDFPKDQGERASVNFHSNSNSRTPRVVDGNYAPERYQVIGITPGTTELRFFSNHVQKLLYDFDKVKLYVKEMTFLLENVSADDREFITSILTSLEINERNALLVCSIDGMNKEKLVPWIGEFFISYPHFVEKETVIWSMCRYLFTCQTPLKFKRDPFCLDLESNLPCIIEAGSTSIAANEIVATLEYLDKKYLLLKASQIELLEKIFKFDGDIKNYAVIVIEKDNEYDTANFTRHLNSSKIIAIKYAKDAPIVRCKVDDLTDECKKVLLSTKLCLQGRPVKLHDFVGSAEISDALLHSLLRGKLHKIPECTDIDPSNTYIDIERRLKKLPEHYQVPLPVHEAMKLAKILIIADLPGAGKTTVVTKLSLKLDDWVIKVNLNEKSKVLEKWHKEKRNIRDSTPEDLLSELAGIDPLLKPLLQSVMQNGKSAVKICVICDAFDEVKADYAELVIEFLKRLMHESNISNIIVTTRPHLRDKLEKSLQSKSCPLGRFSFRELIELHRKGQLERSLHTESSSLVRFSNDELIQFFLNGELEKHIETKSCSLVRFLHEELIELHFKSQIERCFQTEWAIDSRYRRYPYSYHELVELHRQGKFKKSLQTEWCPLSEFTGLHEDIIDLHLNGKKKKSLHPESPKSRLLENFLDEKVFKYLIGRMEKSLQNESCPSRQSVYNELIKSPEFCSITQSLNDKLSFLIDFSYEELLKLHVNDKMENSVKTNSFSLDTLSHEESIEFMTRLIAKPNYNRGRVKKIFEKFAWNIDNNVKHTPMMLQLIAGKLQDLNDDSTLSLSVHSLYSDYIKNIFKQYVEVKAGAQKNDVIAEEMQEILFTTNINFYYYFAVKEILRLEDIEIESYGLKRPCTDKETDRILRHGLIVGPNFFFKHRSYADFFLAKWLMSVDSRPQTHKIFVDIITGKRAIGNNIFVFFEGEAGNSSDGKKEREKLFFEQMADYYCMHKRSGILYPGRKELTRYIFDGVKKFCDESTLQRVLLKGNGGRMLFETDTIDHLNFVMALYHEAGLTSEISKILKSNVKKIANCAWDNKQYLFALLKLVADYCDYDGVMKVIRVLNSKHMNDEYEMPIDLHIKIFKWEVKYLRVANQESELKKLILDVNAKGNRSFLLRFPHIVYQGLKEMNSSLLNELPKVFEATAQGQPSIWTHLILEIKRDFRIKKMRYVCSVMFPDQYGDHAANEYKLQFLDHENKMLKFTLNEVANEPVHKYASFSAVLLEMAISCGLSDEDVETVLDVIFECAPGTDCLSDHLFTFASFGLANAMKKLLSGVKMESDSNMIRIYTVDINERDISGRTALEIAETFNDNKHKMVADIIRQHLCDRGDHGQDHNPWTFINTNSHDHTT